MTQTIHLVRDPQEFPTVRILFQEYAESLGFSLQSQNFSTELEELPGKYAPPGGCILLAMVDDLHAGCVALRPLADRACEMKRLYVRPQHRKIGLGRALAVRAIAEAQALGYSAIRLDTLPSAMPQAVALYCALGFQPIPPYWNNPLHGVEYMELKL